MNFVKKNLSLMGIFILMLVGSHAGQISAQGFIIPPPDRHPHFPLPRLTEHKVNVDILDQVANVEVHQVFYNHDPPPNDIPPFGLPENDKGLPAFVKCPDIYSQEIAQPILRGELLHENLD